MVKAPVTVVLTPERYTVVYRVLDASISELETKGFSLPEIEASFLAFLANWASCQKPGAVESLAEMHRTLDLFFEEFQKSPEQPRVE